jgi:hypothetical protein
LIRRLSQRLREADDRIVNDERRSGRALVNWNNADSQKAGASVNKAYLAAKSPWLLRQLHTPLELGDLPFVVGREPNAGEELPPLQPDLKLDDTPPFRLSRNHFVIEKRDGSYHVHDLRSALGTIVNGFWLARWLEARGVESHVIHPSSVAVSREHRRAKTDRLPEGREQTSEADLDLLAPEGRNRDRGSQTPRWRKPDSNLRSPPSFDTGTIGEGTTVSRRRTRIKPAYGAAEH